MLTKKHSCMIVLLFAMLSILSIAGCTKKDTKQSDASKAPALAHDAAGDTAKKDSADLFDEFYNEKETGKGVTRGSREQSKNTAANPSAKAGVSAVPSADASAFDENGAFVVQISCVRSNTLAEHLKSTLSDKGYPAYVSQVESPTPTLTGSFYRVRIGNFRSVAAAKSFAEGALTGAGFEYWVDNKANDNVGISGSGFGSSGATGYESSGSSGSSYESTPAVSSESSSGSTWGSSTTTSTVSEPAAAPATTTTTTTESTYSSTPEPAGESKPATTESSSSWTTSTTESSATPASSSTTGSTTTTQPAAEPAKTDNTGDSWGNDSWGTSDTTQK